MINVAILGYGTVGSGVFEVLNENKESISRRAGQELHVKYVLDLRDFPGQPVEKVLVHDYEQIVSDPEVDIVVEVMGGVEPAYTFVKKALLAGKNVCTSNKALVAKHGRELMDIAKEKSINFLFEASCGGGIPIIRVINSSLTGDEIDEVTGILNGTTNYMLYKMSTEGCEFDTVLKEAQQKGYAEADPTADVEGYDACRKIAILSSLAYERYFDFEDIYTEENCPFEMDKATVLKEGTDVAIIACGEMVRPAVEAAEVLKEQGISASVLDMYCVKPLDMDGVIKAAKNAKVVITAEEHAPFGGLGSMVAQVVGENCPRKVINMALPDAPVITGTSKEVFDYYGLNAQGIAKKAAEALKG